MEGARETWFRENEENTTASVREVRKQGKKDCGKKEELEKTR